MTELVGSVILAKLDWLAQSVKAQGNAAELGDDLTPAAFADAAASICNRVVGYRPRHGARSVSAEATCDLFDFLAGSDMLARLRNLSRFSPEPACAATETRAGEFWNLAALIQNVFEHATDYNPSVEYTVLALTEFQARTVVHHSEPVPAVGHLWVAHQQVAGGSLGFVQLVIVDEIDRRVGRGGQLVVVGLGAGELGDQRLADLAQALALFCGALVTGERQANEPPTS